MSGRRSSSRVDHPVQLVVGVGEAGEIALLDDGRGEARLGEDHHAGGRLDQVRAGARADDEEEGVLDLAMQPDDAGEAAKDLALAALVEDRASVQPPIAGGPRLVTHLIAPAPDCPRRGGRLRAEPCRPQLQTNCAALTT